MEKINFQKGTLKTPAKVNEDNTITPAVYEGNTPLSPYVLNKMQDNIERDTNGIRYYFPVSTKITSGTNFTIPCYYKVGANVLDVYFCGEKLIKKTTSTDGHYSEVGNANANSNKLKLEGWNAEVGTGDDLEYFEFIVRGDYSV